MSDDLIVVDPKICGGKPTIKDTRIMVKNILGMVAGGYTVDRILQEYPDLTREGVSVALKYASDVIDARGKNTSAVEILNISAFGVWLFVDECEYFASYEAFPWFKDAKVADILNVTRPHLGHLYWPSLDIDLAVESLSSPEKYPLVAKSKDWA